MLELECMALRINSACVCFRTNGSDVKIHTGSEVGRDTCIAFRYMTGLMGCVYLNDMKVDWRPGLAM